MQRFVFIGYSEGGMVAAISCSQNYENISSKINQVIGLGPILTFKSSKGQWSKIAKATSKISAEKVNKEFASGKGMKNLFPLLPDFLKNSSDRMNSSLQKLLFNFDDKRYLEDRQHIFVQGSAKGQVLPD